jgi:folate-dependent phosphoribosylglycinamide formyltransferase PurN
MQAKVSINDDDDAITLSSRVLKTEHKIYKKSPSIVSLRQTRIQK